MTKLRARRTPSNQAHVINAIRQRGLTVVDIVAALDECGYSWAPPEELSLEGLT